MNPEGIFFRSASAFTFILNLKIGARELSVYIVYEVLALLKAAETGNSFLGIKRNERATDARNAVFNLL